VTRISGFSPATVPVTELTGVLMEVCSRPPARMRIVPRPPPQVGSLHSCGSPPANARAPSSTDSTDFNPPDLPRETKLDFVSHALADKRPAQG
jgi:hypothetical protein